MSKLFNLKEWLTVPDAAKRLSVIFEEEVTEADVLRLSLDGHLKLSVHLINLTKAEAGKVVTWDETDWFCAPPLNETNKTQTEIFTSGKVNPEKFKTYPPKLQKLWEKFSDDERKKLTFYLSSIVIDDDRFLNLNKGTLTINGVWDLPLFGSERLDIEHKYQMLTDGHDVTDVCLDGVFIEEPNSLKMYRLQDGESDYPSSTLPQDSVLVVRTAALREFEQNIADLDSRNTKSTENLQSNNAKPESTRKIENLLKALTAIAMDDYGYDPKSAKSAAPQDIVDAVSQYGIDFNSKTVRGWLKEGTALLPINQNKIS